MIEPLIKLPSMIEDELHAEIADKDAEIQRLQELVEQLSRHAHDS